MTRKLIALLLVAWLAVSAKAQDMPLSQILIDGEGWKKAEGQPEKPHGVGNQTVKSPDGATQFSVRDVATVILAHRMLKDGNFGRGVPYCHLRTRWARGGIVVTGLAVDRDGRIYAATEIGVQVFDPTGRLCGVLSTPVREDIPTHLAFEGDRLTVWVGDTKYARKLNTAGAK